MEILKFKLFCIEMYRIKSKLNGKEIISLFNKYGVLNLLKSVMMFCIILLLYLKIIVSQKYKNSFIFNKM